MQCLPKCVCVTDVNRNKKRETERKKISTAHTQGSLVWFYIFCEAIYSPLPQHKHTQRVRQSFILYPTQYEIIPLKISLKSLTIDLSAGKVVGASEEETAGENRIVKTLYHYGVFIPKTYYDVCSLITCCGVRIYLPVCECVICVCF